MKWLWSNVRVNDDTRFIIERMDALEQRVVLRIDALEAWRNKIIGLGVLAGGAGSFLMEIIIRKLS